MQLRRIYIHHWGPGIYTHIDCNRFRSRRTQQRNGLIHQIGNIHHLARRRAPPAEGQNPLDQILRAVASTPNLVEAGSDIFVSRGVQQGESGVPEDRRQDIVEIVRHTARQRAKGLKLLRLSKLLL